MQLLVPSLLLWFTQTATVAAEEQPTCDTGYDLCAADGAGSGSVPGIGEDMADLYSDIVDSINSAGSEKRGIHEIQNLLPRADSSSLCCASGMQCLLLKGIQISFCWDRFTTNFHFEDGSYGSVTTGVYNLANSDVVNLILGNYTLSNGETGNIYSGKDESKPEISTMDLPSPWTSEGVGSAIPGSELGAPVTYIVTTVDGTTRADSTIPATTIAATTVSGAVVPATTISASVVQGTTTGPATVTITEHGSGPAPSSTTTGAANHAIGQLHSRVVLCFLSGIIITAAYYL